MKWITKLENIDFDVWCQNHLTSPFIEWGGYFVLIQKNKHTPSIYYTGYIDAHLYDHQLGKIIKIYEIKET